MANMKPMTILRKFFGYKEGQGLKEFTAEMKELSPEERVELATLAVAEMPGDELDTSAV